MAENTGAVIETNEEEIRSSSFLEEQHTKKFLTPKEIAAFVSTSYGTKNLNAYVDTWKQYFLLNYTGLSGSSIALMNTITSVWDALDDPLSGIIIDRFRTRWGRLRPFLILPTPLWAICTILFFTVPYALPMSLRPLYAIVISVLNSIGMSYFNAWQILLYNITPNPDERNTLITTQKFVELFGVWIPSMVPVTVDFLPKLINVSQERVYFGFAVFFVGLLVVCAIFAFRNIRERVPVATKEDMENVSIWQSIKYCLTNRPLFVLILGSFLANIKSIGGANESLFWLNCTGRLTNGTIAGLFTGIPNYIVTPLAPKLIKKFGARNCAIFGGIFAGIAYSTLYIVGYTPFEKDFNVVNFIWVTAMLTVCGLPNCLLGVCGHVLKGDVYDYLEWKTGVRNEGIINAVEGYMTKLSGTAVGAMTGLVIEIIRYTPLKDQFGNLIPQTDPSVLRGLWAIFCLAPAVARFGYGFAMMLFNVHGKFRENMLTDLDFRRKEKITAMASSIDSAENTESIEE